MLELNHTYSRCAKCGKEQVIVFDNLKWLTTKEAATYLRVSLGSLKNLVYRGYLKPSKLGRLNRFKKDELDRLLENSILGGTNAAV